MTDIKVLEKRVMDLEKRVERLEGNDPLYEDAKRLVIKHHKTSVIWLQKMLFIDIDRATRMMERLKAEGLWIS